MDGLPYSSPRVHQPRPKVLHVAPGAFPLPKPPLSHVDYVHRAAIRCVFGAFLQLGGYFARGAVARYLVLGDDPAVVVIRVLLEDLGASSPAGAATDAVLAVDSDLDARGNSSLPLYPVVGHQVLAEAGGLHRAFDVRLADQVFAVAEQEEDVRPVYH